MEIFCTYCSKDKDKLIKYLPAIHRYKSKRIRKVNESANSLGFPMFILSGKYGLISADHRIRYYDHLLKDEEVEDLVQKKILNRLKKRKITNIYFFLDPSDTEIKPYIKAITRACKLSLTKITFLNIEIGDIENISKNGYREIWYSALKTNQTMVMSKDIIGKSFQPLFRKYPNDGMLFYERGEAFESLEIFEKAQRDYEMALFYFPNPKWKKVAYEGLKRIHNNQILKGQRAELDRQWKFFHEVNSAIYLPHDIRAFTLSSIERFQEEKRLAIGELRICLEMIVFNLSKRYKTIDPNYFNRIDFSGKIEDLKKKGCKLEICFKLKKCWDDMGEIIHPIRYKDIPDENFFNTLDLFIDIILYINKERLCILN